jgi:acyl-CoA synthetase (AMP-forming)/AMP-acid ligase II
MSYVAMRARAFLLRRYSSENYASFILRHVERSATARPNSPCLVNGLNNDTVLYKDFGARVGAAQRGFRALGIGKGNVVGLHLPNCPEYIIAFNALASLGAVVTTSNPAYSPTELTHQFRDSGAELVVTIPALEGVVREAANKTLGMKASSVVTLGSPGASFLTEDVTAAAALRALPAIEAVDGPSTLFCLPYSSGTTGLPKGVRLSHSNLTVNLEQSLVALKMQPTEAILAVLPFYHIYGITCLMGMPLLQGASVVTLPKFDPPQFLGTIQKYKCGFLFIVPPIISFLAKHPLVGSFDLSHVRSIFSGAAPLDGDTQTAVERRFPLASVRQGYGMTECSPIATSEGWAPTEKRAGSIGKPLPDTQCRVVDAADATRILPPGKANVGELQVKGPQVMMGYHNNARATEDTLLPGGWLRTGDMVYQDQDGFYFVVDRIKELIKVKGFQVAPAELEGLLLGHPLVYDAAVVAKADERSGEVPVAFVVSKAAMLKGMGKAVEAAALPALTADAVKAFISGKVAEYKQLCVE